MPESWSRRIFLFEAVFLAAPMTMLYLIFGMLLLVLPGLAKDEWYMRVVAVMGVGVFAAVLAAWVLILSFLGAGTDGLRRRSYGWWLCSLLGASIVVVSAFSSYL